MSCMKDGFCDGLLLDGRFQAIAPLNHGSFGMVFLAKDLQTDEQVAIKCLLKSAVDAVQPENQNNDHLVELNCHDRLGHHANIVNLVSAFESDAHLFLVLEYCPLGDLYEAIRAGRGPLETQHVRSFMLQLVDAVDFIHAKGLYHRDIKPENIFLAQDGSMKLGDFGLATTETWTHEASVGSDRYMAPEQYDPTDVGYSPGQADIWSIGICLLNVLFSRNPFVVPAESDILFADFVRDRQSLFDIFPSMSQDTYEVLTHALSIDPSKRSLAAVRDALERVISFTTDDDLFDDFCVNDGEVVTASANRMPFRTPSIQSPPIETGGAFPWAKALHTHPPHVQSLEPIYDGELHTELYSEKDIATWCTPVPETPSMSSVVDSALGQSVKSMQLKAPPTRKSQMSESVPIQGHAMSTVFGNDNFSKSWSDLWDEEEEEEDARKRYNARNWSTESLDISPVADKSEEATFDASTNTVTVAAPPTKQSVHDKWSALGNRRRAVNAAANHAKADRAHKRATTASSWRRDLGFSTIAALGTRKTTNAAKGISTSAQHQGHATGFVVPPPATAEGKDNRSRERRARNRDSGIDLLELSDWRKGAGPLVSQESRGAFDDGMDAEWVGGWRDLHL